MTNIPGNTPEPVPATNQAGEVRTEWRCFHCGDAFTDERCARLHFGRDEDSAPACQIKAGAEQGLLGALRDAEYAAADAMRAIADECTDAAKAYYSQMTRHNQALRNAEELGYERGLADARALATQPATSPCADCKGTGYSGGVIPSEPELCDACETCFGEGVTPQPATSQEGEVRGWKCNNCQTVFTSAQQERKPNDSNGGPTCPYCKAHGQYTYPYALHQGDPCGGCGIAHDDVASGPCVPTLATKPETAQDGEDLESEIADAIDDSLDMDWTGSIGARHVMELLRSKGLVA